MITPGTKEQRRSLISQTMWNMRRRLTWIYMVNSLLFDWHKMCTRIENQCSAAQLLTQSKLAAVMQSGAHVCAVEQCLCLLLEGVLFCSFLVWATPQLIGAAISLYVCVNRCLHSTPFGLPPQQPPPDSLFTFCHLFYSLSWFPNVFLSVTPPLPPTGCRLGMNLGAVLCVCVGWLGGGGVSH